MLQAVPCQTANGRGGEDSDWARDSVVPQISNNLKAVAASRQVQFMDLRDTFQTREICAKTTSLATLSRPSPRASDWGRFLSGATPVQGDLQEAIHPNAYGQKALGTCLKLVFKASPGAAGYACNNRPGGDTSAMTITPIAAQGSPSA